MSGTSMDGVDLSVIKSDGLDQFSSIYNTYKEFDHQLYKQLINLRDKISNSTDLDSSSEEINAESSSYLENPADTIWPTILSLLCSIFVGL